MALVNATTGARYIVADFTVYDDGYSGDAAVGGVPTYYTAAQTDVLIAAVQGNLDTHTTTHPAPTVRDVRNDAVNTASGLMTTHTTTHPAPTARDTRNEAADVGIQAHITGTGNPHTPAGVGAEAAGAVAAHSGLTTGVHGVGAGTVAEIADIPALSTTVPEALGVAAVGDGTTTARANHVHVMPSAGDVGAENSGAVGTHSDLTDGVHGVSGGTIAEIADITAAQAAAVPIAAFTAAGVTLHGTGAGTYAGLASQDTENATGGWSVTLVRDQHLIVSLTGNITSTTPGGLIAGERAGGIISNGDAYSFAATGLTALYTDSLDDRATDGAAFVVVNDAGTYKWAFKA